MRTATKARPVAVLAVERNQGNFVMLQTDVVFQDRYRIQCEVGRGSFGIVYAAEDLQTGQTVAVKVLLPWTRTNESLRHRLKREAKLTRLLKSPHAVRILDLQEIPGGDLYIVMELLSGEALSQVLEREKRLSPARASEIARQTLDALGESHAMGVIHRDLKPHNIFICRAADGSDLVKVLDFGIAKVAGTEDGSGLAETTRLTAAGGVVGTPPYMSPEQCRGEATTPASDFYSLGIVLYELITGRVPFDDPSAVQVLVMHNSAPLPPLPSGFASSALGWAITRSLEKDPRARFRSAAEFMAAINVGSVQTPMPALPPQNVPASPPAAAPPTYSIEPQAVRVDSRHSQRRKSTAFARGGLRVYLFAVVIVILLGLLVLSHYL
jgi:serine/threonine-protein kinase